MSVMGKKSDGMSLERIINQLGSLKSNSEDFARNEKDEPDSIWREDIATLGEAISILSDLQDYGCSTADEFRNWFHDVKLMQKEYQSMYRRFRVEERPYHRDGVWHCPACDHRVMPKHSFCHWCGKKLGGR